MITVYAIIASLLLGGFVRHNFNEMKTSYRWYRLMKKETRRIAKEKLKVEAAADKVTEAPLA